VTRKKKPAASKPLTRAHELECRQLNNWADMLLGIPCRHGDMPAPDEMNGILRGLNEGRPLREPFMWDKDRLEIAMYLRGLAQNPVAIKALTTRRRRVGNPGKGGRTWGIALDYEKTQERINLERQHKRSSTRSASGDAQNEVAKAHGIAAKTVKDTYTQCRKLDGWKHWASLWPQKFPQLKGVELLRAISDELRAASQSG
jgi:hypothetical protein